VRRAAGHGPHRAALRSDDRLVTWGELDARSTPWRGLRALELPADQARAGGHRAAERSRVRRRFRVLRAGLVAVRSVPGTARELRHSLIDSSRRARVPPTYSRRWPP
jgi:hypothetical protein